MKILAIGCNSGGFEQVEAIVPYLYLRKVAIILLSHGTNEPIYTHLKEAYEQKPFKTTPSPVNVITDDTRIEIGKIYIDPTLDSQKHTIVPKKVGWKHALYIEPKRREHPIDDLFGKLAAIYRKNLQVLVLNGKGNDSVQGSKKVKEHGGKVAVCYQIPNRGKFRRFEYIREEYQKYGTEDKKGMPLSVARDPDICDFVGDEREIIEYLNEDFLGAPRKRKRPPQPPRLDSKNMGIIDEILP